MSAPEHSFLEVLRAAGLEVRADQRGPTADLTGLPAAVCDDPAAVRYAATALDRECGDVADAPEGVRNDTLNRAAFNVGQLVGGGFLTAEQARDRLTDAGRQCGLDDTEINRTIGHALRDGAQKPRVVRLTGPTELPTGNTTFTAPTGSTIDTQVRADAEADVFGKAVPGDEFIFTVQVNEAALWGDANGKVLWAPGEALMLTGPPGVGKTTVAQQLTLARCGLLPNLLELPVQASDKRVLYLAMDRPRQIARSMRRMVDDGDRDVLHDKLRVWKGPLPADITKIPDVLVRMCEYFDADTLIVDSVKDAALGLSDSEQAGRYNKARQMALADGIEIVEIAHQVKKGAAGSAPKTLADVHGGMELTAGAGSVVLVWGAAGDPAVELHHLKQPAEMVGPLNLMHDHDAGRTSVEHTPDAGDVLKAESFKVWTPQDVAAVLSDSSGKPSRGEVERVRRKLEKLADRGVVTRSDGEINRYTGHPQVRYQWAAGSTTYPNTNTPEW